MMNPMILVCGNTDGFSISGKNIILDQPIVTRAVLWNSRFDTWQAFRPQ
jgi:hypothetical protein